MAWNKVKINRFLEERADRISPEKANEMGLDRLEKIDFSGTIHVSENQLTRTGMILVKNGDLVISGINVEKGALAVYEGDEDLLATIHYSSYSYDKSKIDIEFLKWFLKSRSFRSILLAQTRGGIKTELKPKRFLPLEVILPDLPTQIEIRNKLNSVNEEVNEATRVQYENEKLIQKLRQAILLEAIQGKLVPQDPNDEPASVLLEKIKAEKQKLIKEGEIKKEKPLAPITKDEIPFVLPRSWEWVRLGDVQKYIQRGPSAKYSQESSVKIINQKCIRWNELQLEHVKCYQANLIGKLDEFRYLRNGDLLVNSTGTGTIGRAFLIDSLDGDFVADSHVTVLRTFKGVNQSYVCFFIQTPRIQNFINNGGVGGSTNQIELSRSIISNFMLPLPPENEQKRIVQKVSELMILCDELEKKITENQINSEKLMDAILREAFAHEA